MKMVVEREQRERREKERGEGGRGVKLRERGSQRITTSTEGSRPTHACERWAHMAVADRILTKQDIAAHSEQQGPRAGPPVGAYYCSPAMHFPPSLHDTIEWR
jgi:hypothetical protein